MKYLQHKHILLTRTAEQNKDTAALVIAAKATPIFLPCTMITPCVAHIQQAWQQLKQCNPKTTDIIFSSRNGVASVAHTVTDFADILSAFNIIAVGKKTQLSLENHGLTCFWTPLTASQKGLIQGYKTHTLPQHIIFFRAKIGNDCLLNFLEQQGVSTQLTATYTTTLDPNFPEKTHYAFQEEKVDAVLLGSARTAEFYVQKIKGIETHKKPIVAVMSQQVRKAADKLGLNVQVTAKEPSFESMLQGLNDYFATHDKE